MSWAEIKKAVNDNLTVPLNRQCHIPRMMVYINNATFVAPRSTWYLITAVGAGGTGGYGRSQRNAYPGLGGGGGGGAVSASKLYFEKGMSVNITIDSNGTTFGSFMSAGAGGAGEDVSASSTTTYGAGGHGGKIYITTLEVEEGAEYDISIGIGGDGGICIGAGSYEGEEGTATTFGELSSENGTVSSIGFVEIFEGINYGNTGLEGEVKGADGGSSATKGGDIIYNGVTYIGGAKGTDGKRTTSTQKFTYKGGSGADGCVIIYYYRKDISLWRNIKVYTQVSR